MLISCRVITFYLFQAVLCEGLVWPSQDLGLPEFNDFGLGLKHC